MDKLKKFLSGNEGDDDSSTNGIIPNLESATKLSWSTRIQCFVFCFVLGLIISLLGSLALFLGKGISLFAFFYTLGNIVSMLSTCFLMGPVNQIKKMFASTRIVATIMVFVMICLTLFAALYLKLNGLALLFLILQWLAMTWYSLSYIPYARDLVKKSFDSCIAWKCSNCTFLPYGKKPWCELTLLSIMFSVCSVLYLCYRSSFYWHNSTDWLD